MPVNAHIGASIIPDAEHPLARDLVTPKVNAILTQLHREFEGRRTRLLRKRQLRQHSWDLGAFPKWPANHPGTGGSWKVAAIPADIRRRRVEITGPVNDTKMVINMLNPGPHGVCADMAMLDFEDSMKPTWINVLEGHCNVIGAMRGRLEYTKPATPDSPAKTYHINQDQMAHPMVRIRGLHLDEKNIVVNGQPVAAGLFDLVIAAVHAVPHLLERHKTPLFYVPKCEHFLESNFWNELFGRIETLAELPSHCLRVTYLIETLPAAFQMEEILYESRERATGLNVGRWDKIFSDIKVLREHKECILADRSSIDMTRPWMDNYARHLINVCHRHGAFAMGGMAAFTPGKDAQTRAEQSAKVSADKKREAQLGHDGCWVSHPYFIRDALAQFESENQLDRFDASFPAYPDLLPKSDGPKTLAGLRKNIRVAIAYVRSWNQGLGCIAIDNLMEDLATLEISRVQTWQWLHHHVTLDDGMQVTPEFIHKIFQEETQRLLSEELPTTKQAGQIEQDILAAGRKAEDIFLRQELADFFGELA